MTYYYDSYSWPQDPALVADSEGVLHACWWQQHYGSNLEPTFRGVFYYMREAGTWTDTSDLLEGHGHMARDSDMALGAGERPVFVFAKEEYPAFQAWLALDPGTSAAPSPAATAGPRLLAHPNPFNPATRIRYEGESGRLSLTVHDVAGRKLRTLFSGEGPGELVLDWDGRDDGGHALPAGLYVLRAGDARQQTSLKMVLLP